jgi:hypothetical protein
LGKDEISLKIMRKQENNCKENNSREKKEKSQ